MELIRAHPNFVSRSRASFDSDGNEKTNEVVSTIPSKNLRVADLVLETLLNGWVAYHDFNVIPPNLSMHRFVQSQ